MIKKIKEILKNTTLASYWHVEIFVAIPIVIVWTLLLVKIAYN